MKKIFKKFITIAMVISMTFMSLLPVKAFDSQITVNASKSTVQYNGYDWFEFKNITKQNNTSIAAMCTKFKLNVPSVGIKCTISNNWPEEVQAGVAKIIELAREKGLNNNDMNEAYYYAELAINEFLYYYNGKDTNNLVSSTRSPEEILGSYYYYYTNAIKEYNRVKKDITLNLTRTGKWSYYFDDSDTTTNQAIDNTYKINGESDNNYKVEYETNIINTDTKRPSNDQNRLDNLTIKITDANGRVKTTPFKGGDSFKVQVTGIRELEIEQNEKVEIKIKVTGIKSYYVAANYNCGSNVQTLTVNEIETRSKSKDLISYITIRKTAEPDYPSLKIKKLDGNNQILPGATIRIEKNNQYFDTLHTEDGILQIDDLEEGHYSIQEIEAPDGYNIDSTKYEFDVPIIKEDLPPRQGTTGFNYDETNNILEFYLQNNKNLISISKVDEDGNNLGGAKLKIIDEDGHTVSLDDEPLTWDTTEYNPKKLRGLPAGVYYVAEEQAPNGYKILRNPVRFEVPNNTTLNEQEQNINVTVRVSVPNKKTSINIRKIDTSSKNRINGAVFQIIDKDTNTPVKFKKTNNILYYDPSGTEDSWRTTENDQTIIGLYTGKDYILREISAPSGYKKLGNDVTFRINAYGGISNISGATSNQATISVENDKTSFKVSKKDVANNKNLAGARLQILDNKGKVVKVIVTNDNKVTPNENGQVYWETKSDADFTIEGLPAGTYRIHEIKAPDGYILSDEDIVFTVNKDGTIIVNGKKSTNSIVTVTNKKNELYISKKDITGEDELEGATLVITNLDTKKEVAKWVSGKTPKHIEALKPGNYQLKEIQAPNGYVLSTEAINFTVSENGKILFNEEEKDSTTLIMTNENTKVYISKQDITTKEELPGAHLVVKDEEGNIVKDGEWDSTTEPHLIEGLGEGTYTITEITAPDGYTKSEETITFTIDANGAVSGNTVMYNTPIPDVPSTLSTQSIIITIVGIVLVGTGIGLYIYGIKKKKEI